MKILVRESLLARVRDAVGTRMFRRLYALVGGKKVDLTDNGDKSCALFVSTALVGFKLIREVHVTVDGLVRDMRSSGCVRIRRPKAGCVVVWRGLDPTQPRLHIGFYIGRGEAISNSSNHKGPQTHVYRGDKVQDLYW